MNGMAVPMLVLDAPGGGGKVPNRADLHRHLDREHVVLADLRGDLIDYPRPRERTGRVPYTTSTSRTSPPTDDREGSL